MDIKNWYRSFSRRRRSVRLGNHSDDHVDDDEPQDHQFQVDDINEAGKVSTAKTGSRKPPFWKVIWKKLSEEKKDKDKYNDTKKKKSRLEFSRSVHVQVPRYDEYTYSQNFDNGSNWDEPEQLFKSFSVRYSDPSNNFLK